MLFASQLAVVLFFQVGRLGDFPNYRLTVNDPAGAVIPHAHVLLHREPGPPSHYEPRSEPDVTPDQTLTADGAGHVNLNISSGIYNVCVLSDGFAPTCREFELSKDLISMTITLEFSKIERLPG